MRRLILAIVLYSGVISGFLVAAAPQSAPAHAKKKVDPVAEQRNQDAAFSVLMESYRLLQAHRIEADYTTRVKAAAALTVSTARDQAVRDAQQERETRLAQLDTQVASIVNSYRTSQALEEPASPTASASASLGAQN